MKLFNNYPLYEAKIDITDNETGMFCISLVDDPANETDFLVFNKEKEVLKYRVENEEQRKVMGLVMEADKPIFRVGISGNPYYVTYSKSTIALMVEKYFKNGFCNNVDTDHNFKLEEGITMTQIFIKDTEKGISPVGFEDVNDGSFFAEYHITNDDVWEGIKNGTYKGFSLAGCFVKEELFNKQEQNNKKQNKLQMKVNKVKEMLKKMLATFNEISTDKAVLIWDGDEELKVGDYVHTVDEQGSDIKIEDGEYRTEAKTIIVVEDGRVTEIKDVEDEKVEEVEEPKEDAVEVEVEAEVDETKEDVVEEVEEEPKEDEIAKIKDDIAKIFGLIEEITAQLKTSEERFSKIENTPMAKSVAETFEEAKEKEDNSIRGKMSKRGYQF